MKTLYLVDISSLFFRAYYAIRPLSSPDGTPVNAVYGVLSMLNKFIQSKKPEYLVFCYDRKEPSFRKEIYDDYKANRTEMPDDLGTQIPIIKEMAVLLGIPTFEVDKFEADDIIGTLAKWADHDGNKIVIVSGDKDFGQLVNHNISMFDSMKDVTYDEKGIFEKMGVHPNQVVDYLSLVGDASDNIPGVAGIGAKGAAKILAEHRSMEEIYRKLEEIKPDGLREKLRAGKESAELSKRLVTIDCAVPVEKNWENLKLRTRDKDKLREFLQRYNFKTFEKTLLADPVAGSGSGSISESGSRSDSGPGSSSGSSSISESGSGSEVKAKTKTGSDQPELAAATASAEDVLPAEEFASWITKQKEIWCFQIEDRFYFASEKEIILAPATEIKQKLVWNGFDLKALWKNFKIDSDQQQIGWDAMLAFYAARGSDATDWEKLYKNILGVDYPDTLNANETFKAHQDIRKELEKELKEKSLEKIYVEMDLPLIPVLYQMEQKGIHIDLANLKKQSIDLENEIAVLEKKIHELAGEVFNVASPKQLGVILFEKLKLPSGKKTKTGFSTDTEVLQEIEHEIAEKVLSFRELSKLKSTYVDALAELADANHRVHTTYQQASTATGRLSSHDPNLQNIPIRTPRGQKVRDAFVASEGKVLLSLDYSQIELRVLAHISEDEGLLSAFAKDLDVHAATAAEVFGVNVEKVTADQRRAAKAVNFGISYGQGAFGLAENLKISRTEAQKIIDNYFAKFPGVSNYISTTIERAKEIGYVETLFGRRRYLPELAAKNPMLRKAGERAAINAPMQGTAADLVKKAMIEVAAKISIDLLLQVHDELLFEGRPEQIEKEKQMIIDIMEKVTPLKVPLKINASIGKSWGEAH